ncbi:putative armadillo-like helical protein [Helianthus annuus]|nr:putative armadillo-like helical protein [Helianthus annuus]
MIASKNRTDLVPTYVRLQCDNEAEVCIAAAGKFTKFSRILSAELVVQHILLCVRNCLQILLSMLGLLFPLLSWADK